MAQRPILSDLHSQLLNMKLHVHIRPCYTVKMAVNIFHSPLKA